MQLQTILPACSHARAKQGQEHLLGLLLGLIAVSLLGGRRGMTALLQSWNGALSRDADRNSADL